MTKTALANKPSTDSDRDDDETDGHTERLSDVRLQTLALLEKVQALASHEAEDRQPALQEHITALHDLSVFAEGSSSPPKGVGRYLTTKQLQEFGKLLRDKRSAAGLSRVQLARRAKISDATIKFLETAKHLPSRATLIRLINVEELKLTWADVPGQPAPPAAERIAPVAELAASTHLNCFVSPSYEPVREVAALGRVLNGAGGHVEQTNAYLDPQSAAAYLALCQQHPSIAGLRAQAPLSAVARSIMAMCGNIGLQIVALGPGDGTLELRLLQHLAEAHHQPSLDLCLLDISQPLLSCALKHADDVLNERSQVRVWGMQCNFHDLPLYSHLFAPEGSMKRQRVFCMLGGTMADLDHEPRFFQHSLQGCGRGDLLLLDMQVAGGSSCEPEVIKKRDKAWCRGLSAAHAAWLSGPIWRHCKDVISVDFHWSLDTHCPIPDSYALNAVATVQSRGRDERQFSMFRFRRYTPSKLAACLRGLGWDEVLQLPYGGDEAASLALFCKRTTGAI